MRDRLLIVLAPWRAPAAHAVVGAALGAASAVCYAANVFALRRLSAQVGAARAMSTHAFVGAVVIAPLAVGQLDALTLPRLGVIAAGAVVIGAGCGVAFTAGLLRIGSARAAVLTFLEPVVAVIVGATVWGEPLGAQAVLGGALVLGAGLQVARQAR